MHVIILVPLIVYHMVTWECEIDKSRFSWLKNDACFHNVDKMGVKNILFSYAYFFYDLIYISFFAGPGGELRVQTQFHHIFICIAFLATMIVGRGVIWTTNLVLMSEVSTLFVNYRLMYTKDQLNLPGA